MADDRLDLPQGTLDLLILKTLALSPQHGWAITERLQQISSDALRVGQGSLYPALHRLERRGWIRAKWGVSENNRKAKYYELTNAGRKQLKAETEAWRKLAAVIGQVLDFA
ncbi:MAG TPA: PadR family transcriptional regulator [Bryobacteraceae bacterium]|nr:PadR family transcriptional regulator [Bryobacteraceae bacterium]